MCFHYPSWAKTSPLPRGCPQVMAACASYLSRPANANVRMTLEATHRMCRGGH